MREMDTAVAQETRRRSGASASAGSGCPMWPWRPGRKRGAMGRRAALTVFPVGSGSQWTGVPHRLARPMRRRSSSRPPQKPRRFSSPGLAVGAMPTEWCKDDLSVAYARAVGTAIGVTCADPKRDINGWDVLYRALDTATADAAQLAVQLKCTASRLRRVEGGTALSFPLHAKGYDDLRKTPTHPPRMLVVVEVPAHSPTRWIEVRPDKLLLMASAWYTSLRGEPPLPAGQQTVSVRIPITQRFNPRALGENMRSCP